MGAQTWLTALGAAPPLPTPAPPPPPTTTTTPPAAPGRERRFTADDLARAAGGRGRVPPVVTKDSVRAFEVTYAAGQRGGGSSDANFVIAPPGVFPADEVRMRFRLFLDPAFPLEPTAASPKVGGKLGGLDVGVGAASGGKFSTTAASVRLTWANGGGVLGYVYPQLRRAYTDGDESNISWAQLDQSPEFQRVSRVSKGVHVFMPPGGKKGAFRLKLRRGAWNEVEIHVRLNRVGAYDGLLRVAVNGQAEETRAARFRHTPIQLLGYQLHTFFGGSQRPARAVKAWFADFRFE